MRRAEKDWSEHEYRAAIRELEAERDELHRALMHAMQILVRVGEHAENEVHDIRVMLGTTGEQASEDK